MEQQQNYLQGKTGKETSLCIEKSRGDAGTKRENNREGFGRHFVEKTAESNTKKITGMS